jgi:hypothetical protein
MREELRHTWDAVEFLLDKTEERRDLSRSIRCRSMLSSRT